MTDIIEQETETPTGQEPPRAKFKSFEESTAEDWAIIIPQLNVTQAFVAEQVIQLMRELESDHGGFPVNRLEHSLQTATRAERDGRDDEYVLCALLHDIGDTLGPYNHPDIAAGILKPFVSEANHWMVEHHGVVPGLLLLALHRARPERPRASIADSPYYDLTEEFCAKYDQTAFDADYVSNPLEHYEPLIRKSSAVADPLRRFASSPGPLHGASPDSVPIVLIALPRPRRRRHDDPQDSRARRAAWPRGENFRPRCITRRVRGSCMTITRTASTRRRRRVTIGRAREATKRTRRHRKGMRHLRSGGRTQVAMSG